MPGIVDPRQGDVSVDATGDMLREYEQTMLLTDAAGSKDNVKIFTNRNAPENMSSICSPDGDVPVRAISRATPKAGTNEEDN